MTITELIAALEKHRRQHGDIDVLRWDCTPTGGEFGTVMKASDVQMRTVYWYGCDEDLAMLSRDATYYRQQRKAVLL